MHRSNSRGRSREGEREIKMRSTTNDIVDEDLKDYYGTKGLKSKEMKVDKIYLQKQDIPRRSPNKKGSISRDKL
jgi:hypothetical protein